MRKYPSEDDQRIAELLRRALRDIEDAARVASKSKQPRAHQVRRDLDLVLRVLSDIGTVADKYVEPEPEPKRRKRESK